MKWVVLRQGLSNSVFLYPHKKENVVFTTDSRLRQERESVIITKKRSRTPNRAIGAALGISGERVRQMAAKLERANPGIFRDRRKPLWTAREAAEELRVSTATVAGLCSRRQIECHKNGQGVYLIGRRGMQQLRRNALITRKKECSVCGKKFTVQNNTSELTCSPECKRRHTEQTEQARLQRKPSTETLTGWYRELWKKLHKSKPPKKVKWVTITKAVIRSPKLSRMQIIHLGRCGIITTGEHPTEKWCGKPVTLYPCWQLKIAEQVYKRHKSRKK